MRRTAAASSSTTSLPVFGAVADRHAAAHPHALLPGGRDLVADALRVTSRSNWAKDSSTLSVNGPWRWWC